MRFTNHICYRFLTDDTLGFEIVELQTAREMGEKDEDIAGAFKQAFGRQIKEAIETAGNDKIKQLWNLVNRYNQKAYVITNTVEDKLQYLKVKRDLQGRYDFTVFRELEDFKKTFVLQPTQSWTGGGCLRVLKEGSMLSFCHLCYKFDPGRKDYGKALWTLFFINTENNYHAEHCDHKNVQDIYEGVYKMLCFFFLSENTYEVVEPGQSKGTKKHDKVKNDLNVPLIIVNSKWNITTVRTEGWIVSGHLALRRIGVGRLKTRMVYIAPYEKNGYVRKAKSEDKI